MNIDFKHDFTQRAVASLISLIWSINAETIRDRILDLHKLMLMDALIESQHAEFSCMWDHIVSAQQQLSTIAARLAPGPDEVDGFLNNPRQTLDAIETLAREARAKKGKGL